MISLIVAASTNNVIGVQGELPWRISDDLKRFKALTMGKTIMMGRRTFESIGRALPGRDNFVVTRNRAFDAPGCQLFRDIDAALAAAAAACTAAAAPITDKRGTIEYRKKVVGVLCKRAALRAAARI